MHQFSPFCIEFAANKTIPIAPEHYETRQNISLGSYGLDRVCSLRKILTQLRGINFCINCINSAHLHQVSCSNEMVPNAPKHYETQPNKSLGSNGVDRVRLLQKFRCNFLARTFALIVPVRPILHRVSCSKKMIPNALKHYGSHQNMSLGSNVMDLAHLLRIIPI